MQTDAAARGDSLATRQNGWLRGGERAMQGVQHNAPGGTQCSDFGCRSRTETAETTAFAAINSPATCDTCCKCEAYCAIGPPAGAAPSQLAGHMLRASLMSPPVPHTSPNVRAYESRAFLRRLAPPGCCQTRQTLSSARLLKRAYASPAGVSLRRHNAAAEAVDGQPAWQARRLFVSVRVLEMLTSHHTFTCHDAPRTHAASPSSSRYAHEPQTVDQ
jgi:hypothetical protein